MSKIKESEIRKVFREYSDMDMNLRKSILKLNEEEFVDFIQNFIDIEEDDVEVPSEEFDKERYKKSFEYFFNQL